MPRTGSAKTRPRWPSWRANWPPPGRSASTWRTASASRRPARGEDRGGQGGRTGPLRQRPHRHPLARRRADERETVRRLDAYQQAGADGVFVPGLTDPARDHRPAQDPRRTAEHPLLTRGPARLPPRRPRRTQDQPGLVPLPAGSGRGAGRGRAERQLEDVVQELPAGAVAEPHPELTEPARRQPVARRQPDVLGLEPAVDLARPARGRPGSARSRPGSSRSGGRRSRRRCRRRAGRRRQPASDERLAQALRARSTGTSSR